MQRRKMATASLLALCVLLAACGPADIYVDGNATGTPDGSQADPFPTIQEGLDEAVAQGGGTVFVKGGFYPENVVMERHTNLRPWPGFSRPLIEGAPGAPTVTSKGWNTIDGLQIGGGTAAIEIDIEDEFVVLDSPNTTIIISNCLIQGSDEAIRLITPTGLSFSLPNDFKSVSLLINDNWIPNLTGGVAIRLVINGPQSGSLVIAPGIQDNVIGSSFSTGILMEAHGVGPNPGGVRRAFFDGFVKNNLIYGGTNDGIRMRASELGDVSPELINNTIANMGGAGVWANASAGTATDGTVHPILVNNIVSGSGGSGYQEFSADSTARPAELSGNLFFQNGLLGQDNYVDGSFAVHSTAIELDSLDASGSGQNLVQDPLFAAGTFVWNNMNDNGAPGGFFLTQGGASTSPAVDTGVFLASDDIFDQRTTRTDSVPDVGTVDIGFHYRIP